MSFLLAVNKININLTSFLIAKVSKIFIPIISPLEREWSSDNIKYVRRFLENFNMKIKKKYLEIEEIDIKLSNKDHRNNQESYIDENNRILYRLYIPKNINNTDVLVWFHGGGFMFGSIRGDNHICEKLSKFTNFIVVNVNYGLSPENKYPVAINDGFNSLTWVKNNIKHYGGNNNSIFIAGTSAGANIAALITPMLNFKIKGLVLIYPPLQIYYYSNSYWKYSNYNGLLLSSYIPKMHSIYFNDLFNSDDLKNASPLLFNENKLKKFPNTLIILAKKDMLYDEGVAFNKLLLKNNISSKILSYNDIHGFYNNFGKGEKAFNDSIKFFLDNK